MSKMNVTYAGHSAVFVELGGLRIAIDPWLEGNPLCPTELHTPEKLDLIVLSHGHSDHAGDAVRVAKLTGAKLAATYELAMIMIAEGVPAEQVVPMNNGGSVAIDAVSVTLVNAFHSSSYDGKNGTVYAGEPCGVVLSDGSRTVYHAGDTELFTDMKLIGEIHRPDLALLPIGDRFTMGPKQAALAALWLGCGLAIPIHYKTFGLLTGTYTEFAVECDGHGVKHRELAPGESLAI
jgi:L-ascorbate metabolism protein UlaG (beta-lactamase superfamily)